MKMQGSVKLNNGNWMPVIGLGTSTIPREKLATCIEQAVNAGYRHIDTAFFYQNERIIGMALQNCFTTGKIKREDVFITSKLPGLHWRPGDVVTSLNYCLQRLQVDYLDLFLIHDPVRLKNPYPLDKQDFTEEEQYSLEYEEGCYPLSKRWKAMEELVIQGKVKSIGLSNFNSEQIATICRDARILPAVLQVELNARLPQHELQDFCRKWNIRLCSYSPLGSPGRTITAEAKSLLKGKLINDLALKYKRTAAQILLRNLVQRDLTIVPQSSNEERIKQNLQLFDFAIDEEDMMLLKSLQSRTRIFKWYKSSPEYPFNIPF